MPLTKLLIPFDSIYLLAFDISFTNIAMYSLLHHLVLFPLPFFFILAFITLREVHVCLITYFNPQKE